jgi:hypothetical protein
MIRSRRLALAAVVVAVGLTACGNPNATAPLADQPPVIHLASGQGGSATEAAPAAATAGAADSKIAFMAPTEFVYDGQLPALDVPAGSWFFAPGQQPDLDRIAALAASLGVVGDVRTLPDEQGGGWAVGPEDYSASVLTVGTDGMLNWYLSGAPSTATASAGCGVSISAVAPATGVGTGAVSGGSVDAVASTTPTEPGVTTTVLAPVPPDVVTPDCPAPQPPVGVPTKDEALATAKQLFADWGYDVNSYQFDDPYADEWGASVNASLLLDGMKAPIMLSVGFGENGAVTYASGSLATPQRGADYPTIGAAAGLERLKKQQNQFVGLAADGVVTKAVTNDAVTSGVAVAPGVASVAPCEPEAVAVDCGVPVPAEPITVTLNSVKPDLTMVWAADNTIWLLPAYTFGTADGAQYSVIAVDDVYVQQPDPATATTEVPGVDPGVVTPDTAPAAVLPPADSACPKFVDTPPETSDAGIGVDFGQRWIGLCLSYAESEASFNGFSVRVVRQDGVDLPVTADFSDHRFNVAVKGDIVSEIISIG